MQSELTGVHVAQEISRLRSCVHRASASYDEDEKGYSGPDSLELVVNGLLVSV
jgi:hypothetical protein